MSASRRRAIFLDRDGTLNAPVGFVNHRSLFTLFPWSIEAIRLINRSGFLAVVVTNQSGIARGLYDEALLKEVHAELRASLEAAGAHLDGIYYCPHFHSATGTKKSDCECRKPKPGMLRDAERDLDVDLTRSYVIGDTYSDLEMGFRVGARAFLVMTGFGRGNYEHHRHGWPRQPDGVFEDVYRAVTEIVFTESPE